MDAPTSLKQISNNAGGPQERCWMPFIDRTPILRRLDQDLSGIWNLQKTFPTLVPMLFATDVTSKRLTQVYHTL